MEDNAKEEHTNVTGETITLTNDNANDNNDSCSVPSIRLVIQRYRKANVLIDESKVVSVGTYPNNDNGGSNLLLGNDESNINSNDNDNNNSSVGLLAYISFAKTANTDLVQQAAKTLLHLPVLTFGNWGDGTTTKSVLQLASDIEKNKNPHLNEISSSSLSVVLIPQANLISKVKRNGKSIQYHDQIEKSQGEELYHLFVDTVRTLLITHQSVCRGKSKPKNPNKPTTPDPSIPPKELFRQFGDKDSSSSYASFDERGFPVTTFVKNDDGEGGEVEIPLTKSAKKKLQKIYDAHVKRHEKYLQEQSSTNSSLNKLQSTDANKTTTTTTTSDNAPASLDDSFVQLVAGSFGKRQGLELYSDMGPFCHVVEI